MQKIKRIKEKDKIIYTTYNAKMSKASLYFTIIGSICLVALLIFIFCVSSTKTITEDGYIFADITYKYDGKVRKICGVEYKAHDDYIEVRLKDNSKIVVENKKNYLDRYLVMAEDVMLISNKDIIEIWEE